MKRAVHYTTRIRLCQIAPKQKMAESPSGRHFKPSLYPIMHSRVPLLSGVRQVFPAGEGPSAESGGSTAGGLHLIQALPFPRAGGPEATNAPFILHFLALPIFRRRTGRHKTGRNRAIFAGAGGPVLPIVSAQDVGFATGQACIWPLLVYTNLSARRITWGECLDRLSVGRYCTVGRCDGRQRKRTGVSLRGR